MRASVPCYENLLQAPGAIVDGLYDTFCHLLTKSVSHAWLFAVNINNSSGGKVFDRDILATFTIR